MMHPRIANASLEQLREFAGTLIARFPKRVIPREPPNNEYNGYWKHCPECGHERLFPGCECGEQPDCHCERCGSELAWNPDTGRYPVRDVFAMTEQELRDYCEELRTLTPKKVAPIRSKTSNYFKRCPVCDYCFVFAGNERHAPAKHCERCGSEFFWPRKHR
jgi:uncharacterized protein (DUF983 family)